MSKNYDEPAVNRVMQGTDWDLLAAQKQTLVDHIDRLSSDADQLEHLYNAPHDAKDKRDEAEKLRGILHFLDSIQDAARDDGYPAYIAEDKHA